MNQSVERENAIIKIRKLQSQTVDRGCTEAQAEFAMRKIADLLQTFDLTLNEVSLASEPCKEIRINTGSGKGSKIRGTLVSLANFCDCVVYRSNSYDGPGFDAKKQINYVFFGLEQDIDMLAYLYEVIENAMNTELDAFKRTETYKTYQGHRLGLTNSFELGFNRRMSSRLSEIKAERNRKTTEYNEALKTDGFEVDEASKPFATTGKALVEAKLSRVNDEFKKKNGWKIKYGKGYKTNVSSSTGYYAGQKAASGVSLDRPVGNGGGHRQQARIGGY